MLATYITIITTLILSAFCSGMEIAFLRSNKLRLEIEQQNTAGITGQIIQFFCKHPQHYITTLLVGNNIVLVIFSMKMSELLAPYLSCMQNEAIVSLIVTLVATLVVLLFGEFMPKNIFRSNPNALLRAFSPIAFLMYIILYPITIFCSWCTKILLRSIGVKTQQAANEIVFTRSDLDYLVEELQETETPNHNKTNAERQNAELQILRNALDFSNVKVRDCFVPRTEVVALPFDSHVEMLKQIFQQTGFSKIPIYKEDIDNIIGYIHCSEMFFHHDTWQEHITTIPFVTENMPAQKLMTTFMQQQKSIAVVIDEFGGTAGIVTLEDIMEEIFGEIEDEHDTHKEISRWLNDKELLVSGRLPVDEVNNRFTLSLPEQDDYETIGGMILHTLGGFPKINETLQIANYQIKCLKIVDNRIELVKVILN